ncbi:MAG: hypothetical protein ACP5I1_13310 [Candidatus Hinthialibacter sp.]
MKSKQELVEQIKEDKKKPIRNKWIPYTFGPDPIPLEPYEVDPVSDIPIRLAVERGVISRKRGLALYRTKEDWNGHPRRSIVIAGPIEEGEPFAVWVGDGSYTPPKPGDEAALHQKLDSSQKPTQGLRPEEPQIPKEKAACSTPVPSIQRAAPARFMALMSSPRENRSKPSPKRAAFQLFGSSQRSAKRKPSRKSRARTPQTLLALKP